MARQDSKTTLLAFVKETQGNDEEQSKLPDVIEKWRHEPCGRRVYVLTDKGLYVGKEDPVFTSEGSHLWWTFKGMTAVLYDGARSELK